MARSLKHIWDEPEAWPASGLTARFMEVSDDYLNAGFMLAVPNRTMFEELLAMRDFEIPVGDIEQVSLQSAWLA
jgi:hypothetical protein